MHPRHSSSLQAEQAVTKFVTRERACPYGQGTALTSTGWGAQDHHRLGTMPPYRSYAYALDRALACVRMRVRVLACHHTEWRVPVPRAAASQPPRGKSLPPAWFRLRRAHCPRQLHIWEHERWASFSLHVLDRHRWPCRCGACSRTGDRTGAHARQCCQHVMQLDYRGAARRELGMPTPEECQVRTNQDICAQNKIKVCDSSPAATTTRDRGRGFHRFRRASRSRARTT